MRPQRKSFVPLIFIDLCVPLSLIGADDDTAKKEESVRRLQTMKKTIERVELTIDKDGAGKLVRVDEPIQRWSKARLRYRERLTT